MNYAQALLSLRIQRVCAKVRCIGKSDAAGSVNNARDNNPIRSVAIFAKVKFCFTYANSWWEKATMLPLWCAVRESLTGTKTSYVYCAAFHTVFQLMWKCLKQWQSIKVCPSTILYAGFIPFRTISYARAQH